LNAELTLARLDDELARGEIRGELFRRVAGGKLCLVAVDNPLDDRPGQRALDGRRSSRPARPAS